MNKVTLDWLISVFLSSANHQTTTINRKKILKRTQATVERHNLTNLSVAPPIILQTRPYRYKVTAHNQDPRHTSEL